MNGLRQALAIYLTLCALALFVATLPDAQASVGQVYAVVQSMFGGEIRAAGATDGQVLTKQADGTWAGEAVSAGVTGPGSSTDNAIPRYDGTGGGTLQDSGVTVDDSDNVTLPDAAQVKWSDAGLEREAAGVVGATDASTGRAVMRASNFQAWSGGAYLQVRHDGSNSYVDSNTGDFTLQGANGSTALTMGFPVTITDNVATTVATVSLGTGAYAGGVVEATVVVLDGTDFQAKTVTVRFAAANKSGTPTATVTEDAEVVLVETAGGSTLSTAWTASVSASTLAIQVQANTSLTPTAMYCYSHVQCNGATATIP